jgi:large subunit ribosomal protein L33
MRELITLACTKCKERNYQSTKNKRKHPDRVEFRKYCPRCRTHTPHKETRYASSSIGRVAVSKTVGWGFKSLLACQVEGGTGGA